MEEEHAKAPSHNNPEEAAEYVRSVNSLTDSFDTSIHGFDRYLRLDAWQTFIHALSQLLIQLDSTYFTKLDADIILETIPDKACDVFLARPEEAAVRVQQCVSSDEIPDGPEVMFKMHLQNLPCFDRRGQQAVTRLFSYLQDAHNYLAEVAKQVVMVSEVSSPEQFTFVLQHAVRPIIQLKIPPHLSAPTELKFEKERLTPEELNEENCCNLILPRPFHPKSAKLDTKDPTRCLAAAAHFLIRKKLFNSKVTQLCVAKDFAVAEKKLHLAISGRKYDPGRKHRKENLPRMSKLQIRNHPLRKMNWHLHNAHQLKPSLNNSQKMPPSLSSSKKAKPARSSKPTTIPLLHCNRKMSLFLNNDNNMLLIHLHLHPAVTVTAHFQIMAQNSNCLQQKIPVPYQRNRDTVYIQNLNRFNQFCLIFLYRSKEIHEPHSKKFLPKFSIFSNILA